MILTLALATISLSPMTCANFLAAGQPQQEAYLRGAADAASAFTPENQKRSLRAVGAVETLTKRSLEVCRKNRDRPFVHVYVASMFQLRHRTLSAEYFLLYWDFLVTNGEAETFLDVLDLTEARLKSDPHGIRVVIIREIFRRGKI
jgi:hypothetical protein